MTETRHDVKQSFSLFLGRIIHEERVGWRIKAKIFKVFPPEIESWEMR